MIFFVILNSSRIQKILSVKPLVKIGEVSFSIYVIHLAVLGTFSSFLTLTLNKYIGYNYSASIALLVSLPLIYAIASFMHKYIYLNGVKMANFICKKALTQKNNTI